MTRFSYIFLKLIALQLFFRFLEIHLFIGVQIWHACAFRTETVVDSSFFFCFEYHTLMAALQKEEEQEKPGIFVYN